MAAMTSCLLGISVAWFAYSVLSIVFRRTQDSSQEWEFEQQRRKQLRTDSRTYLWLEPLIDELAKGSFGQVGNLAQVTKSLPLAFQNTPWKANEFVVARGLEGLFVGVIVLALGTLKGGVLLGIMLAGLAGFFYRRIMINQAVEKATEWKLKLMRQLPFTIDLMTLMMEAGATFVECLASVAKEGSDDPLDQELANLLRQLEMGRTRREALEAFADRIDHEAVSEIVAAIVKGEELGAPLAQVLRTQSDDLLLRRSQWAEKAAADAQVRIVFPGMLVMLACMVIVLAPFLLPVIQQGGF